MKNDNIVPAQTRALTKEELQFLPAALEIIETPPSPVGRALMWLLMALFSIALVWAIVGKIDEVAVAVGRVVPSGFTNVVQAEDRGIVTRIHVENGSQVRQGDILIELNTVMTEADVTRLGAYVIDKAREAYRISLARYREGVGTNMDVLDAQTALQQAYSNNTQALCDYNIAVARIENAVGVPMPFNAQR